MGQYFRAVNKTKQEVVCPWCLHSGSKLLEWAANPLGSVFVLLLRKSSGSGGGDYFGYGPQAVEVDDASPDKLAHAIAKAVAMEGRPVRPEPNSVVGRWAGDEVYLVGDYDESSLYQESCDYRNISRELADEWNRFIDMKEMRLKWNPHCNCVTLAETE